MTVPGQKTRNERELIAACQLGDHLAFEEIYALHSTAIHTLAFYVCGDRHVAEDLTQQVFTRAFTALRTFNSQARLRTWLTRIALNVCIDHQRKGRKREFLPFDDQAVKGNPLIAASDVSAERTEFAGALDKAIDKMSRKLREVIILKYINELSYSEIAEVIGCSIGTVSSRLNRGHRFLAAELKDFQEEAGSV